MSFFVPNFFTEEYVRNRYFAGSYVDGKWIAGALEESITDLKGSLQPIRPRDLQLLPEGRRNKEAIVIYTVADLRTLNEGTNLPPDIIVARNKQYQVEQVWRHTTPWTHVKAICFLIDGF